MDHDKEFDGIKQADNALPEWWKLFFIISIFFAIAYAVYFPFSNWPTEKSYLAEVEQYNTIFPPKEELKALPGGENPLREKDPAITAGEKNFKTVCAACHGQDGKGIVGPNLMDKEWLHGSTDKQVFAVIMKGVNPPKTKMNRGPMPPHEASLGAEKVYQIMAWLAKQNSTLQPKAEQE
ncbi:MAG: cbb3-type cytochrome c oxidase N-terminal domain-containing protein [Spirochaetota bacterium]